MLSLKGESAQICYAESLIRELGPLAKGSLEQIIENLKHRDLAVRAGAILALGELADDSALQPLRSKVLENPAATDDEKLFAYLAISKLAPPELRRSLHTKADAVAHRYRDPAESDPLEE